MTWTRNLREQCILISPQGDIFNALWRGNDRNFEKKLGVFDMPKFKGSYVQDLGVKSIEYPLTLFFEGRTHDDDAEDFFTTLYDQNGQWQVVHPVKGSIALQLVSVGEKMQPVDEGNYTEISTQWIQPANIDIILSIEDISTTVLQDILNTIDDITSTMDQLKTALYSTVQSVVQTFQKIAGIGNKILGAITSTAAIVQDSFDSAVQAVDSSLASYGIGNTDPSDVLSASVNLITIPTQANNDFSSRFDTYTDFLDSSLDLIPDTTTEDDFNIMRSIEFNVLAGLTSISNIVITSNYNSRSDIVTAMRSTTDLFNNTIKTLDNAQDNFRDKAIDKQFISQTDSYSSLVKLFQSTQRFLLTQFFNLNAEKTFTLKNDRSPLEITVTEYGTLGENDSNYDLFLSSNNLEGDDILLLRSGTGVVVYV